MSSGQGFEGFVGPISYEADGDKMRLSFTADAHHLNGDGFIYGGMMMSLASGVLGELARKVADGQPTKPLSINCDFAGPGHADKPVRGVAEITRKTRTVLFASAELCSGDSLMLTATAVYQLGD